MSSKISRHSNHGIPCLMATGSGMANTWENAVLALWNHGCHIETEYDKTGDPPSVDATMMMVIEDPMSEPAIHRCFPGGLDALEEYRMEFVEGVKDHWVKHPDDPGYAGEWTYTYSQRFKKYECGEQTKRLTGDTFAGGPVHENMAMPKTIDQVAAMIDALAKSPHSRRQQCVTWQPWIDMYTDDPPCCQNFWMRCSQVPDFDGYVLNANVRFRSRDAYNAAFMNLWGEVAFMEYVAGQLQLKLGKQVKIGRLCDTSDSFHIYGKDIAEFKDRFLGEGAKRPWEDRTWTREFAQPFFDEARAEVMRKIKEKDANAR